MFDIPSNISSQQSSLTTNSDMMSIASQQTGQTRSLDPISFPVSDKMEMAVQHATVSPETDVFPSSKASGEGKEELGDHSMTKRNHTEYSPSLNNLNGLNRSKSSFSFGAASASSTDESWSNPGSLISAVESFSTFGMELRRQTNGNPGVPSFDRGCREVMEQHLRKARLERERYRNLTNVKVHDSIASSVGVPYTKLRSERPFLFDVGSYLMHDILAECLGVSDLSRLHENGDLRQTMCPLLNRSSRQKFQETYDSFVTSFCIPLLHSMAMSNHVFHASQDVTSHSSKITYRYQAFPSIRVVRPGETSMGPQCDSARGHSVGYLRFHVPLTPTSGTNALYTESHPGKEDWHPLLAKSYGLGFLFDGARCLHFNMENTTSTTSVCLDFCIAFYREGDAPTFEVNGNGLCSKSLLEDALIQDGPGFYDEAVIDTSLGRRSYQLVAKKYGNHLLDPDYRVGFPFS